MTRRIRIGLSQSSCEAAAQEVRAYSSGLDAKASALLSALAEVGVKAASSIVRIPTTIVAEGSGPSERRVIATGDHVAFVEFGTGVVGAGTYPATLPVTWGYDLRRTPEAHDPIDPTRWYYYDKDGSRRTTRGQTANAFMLAGAEAMRQEVVPTAREVFSS